MEKTAKQSRLKVEYNIKNFTPVDCLNLRKYKHIDVLYGYLYVSFDEISCKTDNSERNLSSYP